MTTRRTTRRRVRRGRRVRKQRRITGLAENSLQKRIAPRAQPRATSVTSVYSVVRTTPARPTPEFSQGRESFFHHRGHGGHRDVRQPRLSPGRPADLVQPFFLRSEPKKRPVRGGPASRRSRPTFSQGVTFTTADADRPSTVTVIVALPMVTPFTTPSCTVATGLFELSHVTVRPAVVSWLPCASLSSSDI